MQVNWSTLKAEFSARPLAVLQYITKGSYYRLTMLDGGFELDCAIPITDPAGADQADFETNFQSLTNQSPKTQTVSQFELNDKTLKMVSDQAATDSNGQAVITFKCPGTFTGTEPSRNGRFIDSGTAWFWPKDPNDRVIGVEISDPDRALAAALGAQAGAGGPLPDEVVRSLSPELADYPIVKSYHDEQMPANQRGARIPYQFGHIEVEPIGGYGFLPSQFQIKITALKDPASASKASSTFYLNIAWGRKDG